jgi:hypothetical protein
VSVRGWSSAAGGARAASAACRPGAPRHWRKVRHPPSGDVDRIIGRAYEDVLHRAPDQDGLRNYRRLMIDERWTEHDVRQALRKSTKYDARKKESADRIVRRAYQDVLKREPDYNGLIQYRSQVLSHGWDEHDGPTPRAAASSSGLWREPGRSARLRGWTSVSRARLSTSDRTS